MVARRLQTSTGFALSFANHTQRAPTSILDTSCCQMTIPTRPCCVSMEPSCPSQPDLDLNHLPPGIATRLLVVPSLPPVTSGVVLSTVRLLGLERSHHVPDHRFQYLHQLREVPAALLPRTFCIAWPDHFCSVFAMLFIKHPICFSTEYAPALQGGVEVLCPYGTSSTGNSTTPFALSSSSFVPLPSWCAYALIPLSLVGKNTS